MGNLKNIKNFEKKTFVNLLTLFVKKIRKDLIDIWKKNGIGYFLTKKCICKLWMKTKKKWFKNYK